MKRVGSCPSKAISRRPSLSRMEAGKHEQHDLFSLIWVSEFCDSKSDSTLCLGLVHLVKTTTVCASTKREDK